MSNENKKDWERPWTTEEIVEHADNWNLACDAALLNTLKAFGDKILKKAEDVNQKIENLNKDISKIHIQVDLARNEFSSLRNTQFVECRVYEDDETLLSEEPKDDKESNVPEEETLEDFREAVALGLDILDEYYDKVVVNVSDSEGEDEDVPSYVYRRKDPYINRRLPFVIGSEEWHKKWHVGLEETDSENENSSENVSDSESDQFFQNKDHSDASSELSNLSGLNRSKVGPAVVSTTNATQHDVVASTSRSDVPEEPIPKTLSFAEQLAVKLGNVIKEAADSLDEPDVNRRPIQKKPSDYGALFSNEPPPLDDIKAKETHGIFSGGKGLFDDEDEDDLWNPVKTESSSTRQFSTIDQKQHAIGKNDQAKGLFDDDSDDGIFAPPKNDSIQQIKQPYLQSNKPVVPVFNEEPPLFEEETIAKEKKKPTGGVSLFGNSDIFQNQTIGKILKQRKVSSSEESNEDQPQFTQKEEIKSTSKVISPPDDHSKQIPQNKNSNEQPISSVPRNKEPEKKKSLPFDDNIFGDDLFSSVDKKSSTGLFESSSLFSDEETDKLFFSNESTIKTETSKINKKSEGSKNLQNTAVKSPETPDTEYSFRKSSKSNIHSLFDDSKDDINSFVTKDIDKKQNYSKEDPEENKKEKFDQTKKLKSITGLFDDLDDVDDLFSGISKRNNEKKSKKSISFLFDDNDEDDYNIFAPKEKKTPEREKVIKNQTSGAMKNEIIEKTKPEVSLFDDDLPKNIIGNSEKGETRKSTKIKESKEKDQVNKKADTKLSFLDGDIEEKKEISNKEKIVEAKKSTKVEQSTEDRTNKRISLFDENHLNDTEIKSKGETSTTQKNTNLMEPKKQESTIKKAEPKIGLFDDDLDDMDDLFSQLSKKKDVEESSKSDISLFSESSPFDVDKKPKQSGNIKTNITEEKSKELKKPITSKKPNIKVESVKSKSQTKDFENENLSPSIENKNSENSERAIKNVVTPLERSEEVKNDTLTIEKVELPSENKYVAVPSISVAEVPKTTVERPDDLGADLNPPNIETDKYKTSPSALNVKFMDSMPPPDDDWDTYSDNTFDDMEQVNDGYQSQPSSLFDNEPPSLIFNDISFIPKDSESQIKVPSDNSDSLFKRHKEEGIQSDSKEVTNDSDIGSRHNKKIDDSLNESESSKYEKKSMIQEDHPISNLEEKKSSVAHENIENIKDLNKAETLEASNTELEKEKHFESKNRIKSKPPISKKKPDINKKTEKSVSFDLPSEDLNERKDSLFSEILNEDQTDFLFSNTKLQNDDKKDSEISENIISDKTSEKIISFDNSEENQIGPNESGVSTQSDDNMQKNILKITEKLQQISNKPEDRTKPLAVPGKLSHNLNINVGALLPGSALPKREKTQDSHNDGNLSKSLPASRFSPDEVVSGNPQYVPTKPIAILRGSSEESPRTREFLSEKSVSFDGGTNIEVLQSITKDRARIPVKRRPSSRRARQKSLRDSISDFRLDDPIPDEALTNESDKKGLSNEATSEQNTQDTHPSVLSQAQGSIEKDNRNVKETKTNNYLNDTDYPDDLFQNIEKDIKNVNKANIISTKKKEVSDDDSDELFKKVNVRKNIDSLFQDDDLFGNIGPLSKRKHNAKGIESSLDQNSLLSHNRKELITKVKTENEPKIIPQTKTIVGKKSTIDNLFDSSDDEDIFKSTKVRQFKNVNLKKREEPPIQKVETKAESSTSVKIQNNKSDKLFDFSDDEDFLGNFTKRKNDNKLGEKKSTGKRQSNLFDEMDDDDIFGTTKSIENKTKQDVKPSVILKKPPKSTSLRKLENIDGDEDPLSALLK